METQRQVTRVALNEKTVESISELAETYFALGLADNENATVKPEFLKKFTRKQFIETRVLLSSFHLLPETKPYKKAINLAERLLDKQIESMTNW